MLVSFKQTFLTSHFWNPSCFHFWLSMYFFCCFCFCFHVSMFLSFSFVVDFVFGMFYFVLVSFLFCFLFAFTNYERHCFPAILVFLSHVGYKVVIFFSVHVLVIVFSSCVVCFYFRHLICIILCLCCLVFSFKNRTKRFCCLHLVVFFPFLLFCFELHLFLFFIPLNKKDPPKTGHSRNPKKQKCRKNGQLKNLLAQLCSQIVFLILGGGLKNADVCWKHYKNSGFSIF